MRICNQDAVERRSCRLGPYWVSVDFQAGKAAGVVLGTRGSTDDRGLARDLDGVLRGGRIPEHLHVDSSNLPAFTRKVLGRCAGIRPGQVMTYSELARAAGHPRSARAVGQVMANNPFALLIPCHRVVGSDFSLHGFGGGLDMKEWLLAQEGWRLKGRGRSCRLDGRGQRPEARRRRRGARAQSG